MLFQKNGENNAHLCSSITQSLKELKQCVITPPATDNAVTKYYNIHSVCMFVFTTQPLSIIIIMSHYSKQTIDN